MKRSSFLVLILLLAVALFSWWLVKTLVENDLSSNSTSNHPGLYAINVDHFRTDQEGRLKSTLHAKKIKYFFKPEYSLVTEPLITFYNPNKQVMLIIKADHGRVNQTIKGENAMAEASATIYSP